MKNNNRMPKRRILTVGLVFCLLIGMLVLPSTARNKPITGFVEDPTYNLSEMYALGRSGRADAPSNVDGRSIFVEAQPGDEIMIPLTADMFTWEDGRRPGPLQAVTLRDLKQSRLTVRTRTQAGAQALDYVQFDNGTFPGLEFYKPHGEGAGKTHRTACISIMVAEEYVSIKDLDFALDIYVAYGGRPTEEMKITLYGTLSNDKFYIRNNVDYVNSADGTVFEPEDSIQKVMFDAGKGVNIHRKFLESGKGYYATAAILPPTHVETERLVPEVYPSVQKVVKLNTVNMRFASHVTLELQDDNDVYHVYDEDMQFIGMSDEKLPFSDYYFLTNEEIPSFEQEEYLESLERSPSRRRSRAEELGYDTGEDGEEPLPKSKAEKEVSEKIRHLADVDKSFVPENSSGARVESSSDFFNRPDGDVNIPSSRRPALLSDNE